MICFPDACFFLISGLDLWKRRVINSFNGTERLREFFSVVLRKQTATGTLQSVSTHEGRELT